MTLSDDAIDAGLELDNDYLTSGEYELEVFGERFPAEIHLGPLVKKDFKRDFRANEI